jgi:RimJ/RimL family protein N-acetyltransferase
VHGQSPGHARCHGRRPDRECARSTRLRCGATRPARRTPRGGRSVSALAAQAISTSRLDLLPLHLDHAEEMAAVLSDPALHTFIGGTPDTPQALRSRYRRMTAGSPDPAVSWLNWVIRLRDESCLTGTVQATVSPSGHGPIAEIAWVVGTPWQGRWIATEAAQGLARPAAGAHRHRPHPPRTSGIRRRRQCRRAHTHRRMARRRDPMAPEQRTITSTIHRS